MILLRCLFLFLSSNLFIVSNDTSVFNLILCFNIYYFLWQSFLTINCWREDKNCQEHCVLFLAKPHANHTVGKIYNKHFVCFIQKLYVLWLFKVILLLGIPIYKSRVYMPLTPLTINSWAPCHTLIGRGGGGGAK